MRPVAPLDLAEPHRLHVVGVGGPGMSAIAIVLAEMGHSVSGSDLRERAVLERLRAAFKVVLEDPEVIAALNKAGCEEVGRMPVAQITDTMRADLAKWGDVIRAANITLDS